MRQLCLGAVAGTTLCGCTPLVETAEWPDVGMPQEVQAYYKLPTAMVNLTVSSKNCVLDVIVGEPKIVPDNRYRYAIVYTNNDLYDDTFTVTLTKGGLLESINAKAESKVATIAESAINLAGNIDKFTKAVDGLAKSVAECVDQDFSFTFPADLTRFKDTIDELKQRMNSHGTSVYVDGYVDQLYEAQQTSLISPDCLTSNYTFEVLPSRQGICYRPSVTVSVELMARRMGTASKPESKVVSKVFDVPDPNQVFFIPIDRKVFAKFDVELKFEDGMLTQFKSDDPSKVLAALGVPATIVKALLGIRG